MPADAFNLPFDEAIRFLRQKISLPSKTWRDIEGRAHDRSFVVAGAIKDGLIEDLRAAVDDAIAKGETLDTFATRFEQIVAKHGWTGWTGEGSPGGRAWRARVIYETNLKTAYAAGRYAQMTDPDLLKVRPYWMYKHADTRTPLRPRPEHEGWDGLVLRWDDPWWQTHYPPNGWNCSCGVRPVSRREMKAEGLEPDESPTVTTRPVRDPKTGGIVQVPNGIDFGWDHAPGRDWSRGLVPRELQRPLDPPVGPRLPLKLPPLADIARPFNAPRLPEGENEAFYVQAFLDAFGAAPGRPVMFRDASGHAIPISDDLFRRRDGSLKLTKRGRHADMARLAEAIKDPDEIWIDWALDPVTGSIRLVRRYIRSTGDGLGFSVFEWSQSGWYGVTTFEPQRGSNNRPNPGYIERHRTGALLYRWKGE